jgi:hypothetical protein
MTSSSDTFSPDAALALVRARGAKGADLADAAVMAWQRLSADQQRWAVQHFSYQQASEALTADTFCRWCLDQPFILNS